MLGGVAVAAPPTGEVVVSARGPNPSDARAAPEPLIRYARAFLCTSRDSVRFLWREADGWLAVSIDRQHRHDLRRDQALVTWAHTELPSGVTNREIDILSLLALGLTNAQIAARLGTRVRTVSTQVERMLVKLAQSGRGGLAALAVDAGLLKLPTPGGAAGLASIGPVEVEQATASLDEPVTAVRRTVSVAYPTRRPFRLGTVVGVCGASTVDGEEMRRGSSLAIEEINARSGIAPRLVEHVVVDVDIFNPRNVASGFQALFDQDVDAITASYVSAENPFVLDLVADQQVPFLHTATWEEQVRLVQDNPGRYEMVFQTCPSETHYGNGLIRLVDELEREGLWRPVTRTILAVELDSASTHTTNDAFLAGAARSRWNVADVLRIPLDPTNWTSVVDKVQMTHPDIVMVTHFVPDALVALQRALADARVPTLVYYVYGASVPYFRDALGPAAEGVIWSTVTGLYDDPLGHAFRARYNKRFGTDAGWSQASAAYDQARILAAAWATTGTRDPREVTAYLRCSAYRGLNGVYFLGARGQAALSYPDVTADASMAQAHLVYQIQRGEARVISPRPHGDVSAFVTPAWFNSVAG